MPNSQFQLNTIEFNAKSIENIGRIFYKQERIFEKYQPRIRNKRLFQ